MLVTLAALKQIRPLSISKQRLLIPTNLPATFAKVVLPTYIKNGSPKLTGKKKADTVGGTRKETYEKGTPTF